MAAKIKKRLRVSYNHHKTRPRGVSRRAFERVYWPFLPLLIIGVATLLISSQPNLGQRFRHPTGTVLAYATSMQTAGLLADTNKTRQANNLPPLSLNERLNAAAQAKARDMANRNYWSHNTPDGGPPWSFVANQGYHFQTLGENLATGFNSEASTVSAWLASPSHRQNILNGSYSDVGFGSANAPNYQAAGGGPMTIVVAYYAQPTSSAGGSSGASSNRVEGATASARTSNAQIDLSRLPFGRLATPLILVLLLITAGLWLSQHLPIVRRIFARSQTVFRRHPLTDLSLLIACAALFLWLQTAGYIH